MKLKITAIILPALFIASCASFYRLSNQNLASAYDYRNSMLHPAFLVFHQSADRSRLYIKINTADLLYKTDDKNDFHALIKVTYQLYNSYESKTITDSATQWFDHLKNDDGQYDLVYEMDFRTPGPSTYALQVTVNDLNRKQSYSEIIAVDKTNRQSEQNFLVKLPVSKTPLFRNFISGDESVNILRTDLQPSTYLVRCYFRNFPVAPPPFAERIPVKFNYAFDSIYSIEVRPSTEIRFPRKGFYHFQQDTSMKPGLTLFRFDDDFPKLTDASQLCESLRYITTSEEYNKLNQASDKKAAVDQFWIELAGNQERARTLIRKYYTRIQEANRLFTSYVEGWKSDRGMIFIVLGPPTSVFRTNDSEEWTYGNLNSVQSLSFSFEKIYNPFSSSDYQLRRSAFYQQTWYRMVDRWRQGVVIND